MKILTILIVALISHSSIAQIDYSAFEGDKTEFVQFVEYRFSNLYDYSVDASEGDSLIIKSYGRVIPEEYFAIEYKEELASNIDSVVFAILIKSRLIIDINHDRHVFIKYKIKEFSKSAYQVIDLINSNGWIENPIKTKETLAISKALQISSVELFYLFYNQRGDDIIINSLKAKIKGEGGIIDIVKLATIIKANQTQLAKYLDE